MLFAGFVGFYGGVRTSGTGGLSSSPKTTDSGANNVALFERYKAQLAAAEIESSQVTGSALNKVDAYHRAPSFMDPSAGRVFTIRGGDGVYRTLTQVEHNVNGQNGIAEWIVNENGIITHQRFILGGKITGSPNQQP